MRINNKKAFSVDDHRLQWTYHLFRHYWKYQAVICNKRSVIATLSLSLSQWHDDEVKSRSQTIWYIGAVMDPLKGTYLWSFIWEHVFLPSNVTDRHLRCVSVSSVVSGIGIQMTKWTTPLNAADHPEAPFTQLICRLLLLLLLLSCVCLCVYVPGIE